MTRGYRPEPPPVNDSLPTSSGKDCAPRPGCGRTIRRPPTGRWPLPDLRDAGRRPSCAHQETGKSAGAHEVALSDRRTVVQLLSRLKRSLERALALSRIDRLYRAWRGEHVLILAYHNIVPTGETATGDDSLHLPREDFGQQLDLLCETHEIVSLETFLRPRSNAAPPAKRCRAVITFDDAYRGALTAGLEELSTRDLPAVIFVSPGLLGARAFWWDLLSHRGAGVPSKVRQHALTELRGEQRKVLEWASENGLYRRRTLPEHARPATVEQIRLLSSNPRLTLASHGWGHMNLAVCDIESCDAELRRPLDWFRRERIAHEPWIAYPYGAYSQRSVRMASDHYICGFSLAGGFLDDVPPERPARLELPRSNIPSGMSRARFRLLTSGVL